MGIYLTGGGVGKARQVVQLDLAMHWDFTSIIRNSQITTLISEITREFNITTIINTHDMNSVLNIGDSIAFIYEGNLWWEGTKEDVMTASNKELNDFIFSTELTKRIK